MLQASAREVRARSACWACSIRCVLGLTRPQLETTGLSVTLQLCQVFDSQSAHSASGARARPLPSRWASSPTPGRAVHARSSKIRSVTCISWGSAGGFEPCGGGYVLRLVHLIERQHALEVRATAPRDDLLDAGVEVVRALRPGRSLGLEPVVGGVKDSSAEVDGVVVALARVAKLHLLEIPRERLARIGGSERA